MTLRSVIEQAKAGDRTAQDNLILRYLTTAKHYARQFCRNDDELFGELQLELVHTIRNRVPAMYDDRLDRLVGARLYYRSLGWLRRQREEKEFMSQLVKDGYAFDLHEEELECQDFLDQLTPQEKQVIELLMQGYTKQEIADRLGTGPKAIQRIRRKVKRKYTP